MGSQERNETESRREAQDELIITALATGMSYEKAGEVAGCSGRTEPDAVYSGNVHT